MEERTSPDSAADDQTRLLVEKLRASDAFAGTLLDQVWRGPLMRFCYGYLGHPEDAEDAVQEVFLRVLRAAEVPSNFRAWLYRIARNHCLNARRDRARRNAGAALPPESQIALDETGLLTRLVRQELRSRLGQLLAALPETQYEALRLRYVERLARAEAAYVLGIPESVVKSRLFEGLQRLRQHTSLMDPGGGSA